MPTTQPPSSITESSLSSTSPTSALPLPFISFTRTSVDQLQEAMLACPQIELETRHVFNHGGMYRREMDMPAGSTVVGMRHRKDHFLFVCKGVVAITDGDEAARQFIAGDMLTSFAGAKRALHALTDVTLATIHASRVKTVKGADRLVEPDPTSPFALGNTIKRKELTQ